jgi:hypothetical protein
MSRELGFPFGARIATILAHFADNLVSDDTALSASPYASLLISHAEFTDGRLRPRTTAQGV